MTVKTITTSYFRTHLSQCVREARSGVVFIITYRGKPIARLESIDALEGVSANSKTQDDRQDRRHS